MTLLLWHTTKRETYRQFLATVSRITHLSASIYRGSGYPTITFPLVSGLVIRQHSMMSCSTALACLVLRPCAKRSLRYLLTPRSCLAAKSGKMKHGQVGNGLSLRRL
jgi:hypothetical protein